MFNWFKTHDRDQHFWGGGLFSVVLWICSFKIDNNYVVSGLIVLLVFAGAIAWEEWRKKKRTINLGFWRKVLPASHPDWNDVWATLAGGSIIPAILSISKLIFNT